MTITTKGFAQPFEAVGRDIFVKRFDMGAEMGQADLETLVHTVQLTSSIEVIGSFIAETSTAVNMVISGKDVTALAGYTVTSVAGF